MLLDFNKIPDIYLVCGYTDLRKSINGYANMIQDTLQINLIQNAMLLRIYIFHF